MKTSTQPKWVSIRNHILQEIRSGNLAVGNRLPSEADMVKKYKVCNLTIRRSLEELTKEGIIIKRPNSGSFINSIQHKDIITPICLALPYYMLDQNLNSSINILNTTVATKAAVEQDFNHHPAPAICLKAICQTLNTRKYPLTTTFFHLDQFWEDVGAAAVLQGIKGIILFSGKIEGSMAEGIKRLQKAGIKVVHVYALSTDSYQGMFRVALNTRTAWEQILNKFYELGHRRIDVVDYTSHPDCPEEMDEWEVFQTFLKRTGLKTPEDVRFICIPHPLDFGVLKRVFEPPYPTAVVVPDEFPAAAIFRQCYAQNIRIPQDISLAAVTDLIPHTHPVSLTSSNLTRAINKSIEIATQYLLKLMAGEEVIEQEVTLRLDVEWKASVGPVLQ